MTRRSPAAAVLAAAALTALAPIALGQSFTDTEPNNNKTHADAIGTLTFTTPGDGVLGTITGQSSSTSTTSTGVATADYFRIRMPDAPDGSIYRYSMVLTATAGSPAGTVRGLSTDGSTVEAGTDAVLQSSSTVSGVARTNSWYGFGRQEELYYRVTSSSTTGTYTATLSRSTISATAIPGTWCAGPITINSIDTSSVNTDFIVLDSNLNPLPSNFQNDDESLAGGGTGSTTRSLATRVLSPGTYYIAIAGWNVANHQALPADDDSPSDNVLDFAGAVIQSSTSNIGDISFRLSDTRSTMVVPASTSQPQEIAWFQFTVGPACDPYAAVSISPQSLVPGQTLTLTAQVTPGPQIAVPGDNAIQSVVANLSSLGGSSAAAMFDDGATGGDQVAGDNIWTLQFTVPQQASADHRVTVTVTDVSARSTTSGAPVTVDPVPPTNDTCLNAINLTGNLTYSAVIPYGLAGDDRAASCRTTATRQGVWFTYTPAARKLLTIDEGSSTTLYASVFTGGCDELNQLEVDCRGASGPITFDLAGGQQYWILIGRSSASSDQRAAYDFTITETNPPPAPANDTCDNAVAINLLGLNDPNRVPFVSTVTMTSAEDDFRTNCSGINLAPKGVWYVYTAPQDVTARVHNSGTEPFRVAVYRQDTCPFADYFDVYCTSSSVSTSAATPTQIPLRAGKNYFLVYQSTNRVTAADATYGLNFDIQAPVANRDCETAIEITSFPFLDSQNNLAAFDDEGVPCVTGSTSTSRNGVWYTFAPTVDTHLMMREASDQDAFIAIFSGADCASKTLFACDSRSALWDTFIPVALPAGQRYWILVARESTFGTPSNTDVLTLDVRLAPALGPDISNNACAGAKNITLSGSGAYTDISFPANTGPLQTITCENFNPPGTNTQPYAGVWYKYTNGPSAATASITQSFPGSTLIAVFEGFCPDTSGVSTTCARERDIDDVYTLSMSPNTTYYIFIGRQYFAAFWPDTPLWLNFQVDPAAPPAIANGACENATPITLAQPFSQRVYSLNAPTSSADLSCDSSTAFTSLPNTVWYSYTATQNGYVHFRENNTLQDAVLGAFQGCGTASLRCATTGDSGVVPVTAGSTYQFVVGRASGTSSATDFWDVHFEFVPAPTNDTCATATLLDEFPTRIVIPNDMLTDDDANISPCFPSAGPVRRGAWFTFTARDTFILMVDELGPDNSNAVALYEGPCSASPMNAVGCTSNSTSVDDFTTSSPKAMLVQAGQTYYLLAGRGSSTAPTINREFHDLLIYTAGSSVGSCQVGSTCTITSKANCAGTFTPNAECPPSCRADFDGMNGVQVADIFAFLRAWFANAPSADFDGMNGIQVADIFAFLRAWFAGCP